MQQAAYESISPERRELCHLRIGRLLLRRSAGQLAEKELFTAVSHFNLGRQLITGKREKVLLSHLNFDAGCKAKLATALGAACDYFRFAIELSPPAHLGRRL